MISAVLDLYLKINYAAVIEVLVTFERRSNINKHWTDVINFNVT